MSEAYTISAAVLESLNEQVKAEIEGKDITLPFKQQLLQKYGLLAPQLTAEENYDVVLEGVFATDKYTI